ncbi:MAG: DUF4010 domain-containing protein [Lewinellaceae bacterium]|nr:DUF4010 domain-containing protein [Lewinellaceae bacterium]
MGQLLQHIPQSLQNFLIVALFSMLIGLEQRRHHETEKPKSLLGTDRTFTFIGILGYILYLVDRERLLLYAFGGLAITVFLAVFYIHKVWKEGQPGLTSIVVALITYALAPLVFTQPHWLVLLILITVLVLVEVKDNLIAFSEKIENREFITLAKFLAVAGVILPLTPDTTVVEGLSLTPYKFWLAVVAVSTISYVSYLLRKFVFPEAGLLLTGILGGAYSSTATTFTLSRKGKAGIFGPAKTTSAIILATGMMYLRILLLAFLFNKELASKLAVPFLVLAAASAGIGLFLYRFTKEEPVNSGDKLKEDQRNPLEFRAALLFAFLFVFFVTLTHYVMQYYGDRGLKVLSYIVGVTDIDPFLINLFQQKQTVLLSVAALATVQATISNNVLKLAYSFALGSSTMRKYLAWGFGLIIGLSFLLLIWV